MANTDEVQSTQDYALSMQTVLGYQHFPTHPADRKEALQRGAKLMISADP